MRDIYWFLWNEKSNSVLVLPEEKGEQMTFETREAAIRAIETYKYKADYQPIPASKFHAKDKVGSKIEDFLKTP